MAKNTGCFFSVPGFDSQNAHGFSEWSITPAPGYCKSSVDFCKHQEHTRCMDRHRVKMPKHTN